MKRTLNFSALIFFISASLFFFTNGVAHPFYVSVCQIDYNSDTRSLEITLKLFTDDLESVLTENDSDQLYLGSEKEAENADSLISGYIVGKLAIEVEGNKQSWQYLGKEVDNEATWCYLEITEVDTINQLRIVNYIFLEAFDTQTNIVHVKIDMQKKSLLLSREKTGGDLHF